MDLIWSQISLNQGNVTGHNFGSGPSKGASYPNVVKFGPVDLEKKVKQDELW
jgi:hypothetical protein